MLTKLPKPVAIYMDSLNNNDCAILNDCLAEDAHIHDIGEDNHIYGLASIKDWRGNTNDEFQLESKVINMEDKHGIIIVTSLTSGKFPSSPQLFYYFFSLGDNLITNLEIAPGEENVQL
ncbi:MAG: hypothetical protein K0R05_3894 [Anaerocolumna sp.]|jgi:hypothetical protein|nr:hypothetical protein [Anaerocolumna sp.]